MPLEFFQVLIYFVFIFSIVAYATLDGFDLGVGSLHLFTQGDQERRLMINAIGPVWDGNTTWIVIGGGVLFAGFPKIFADLSSSLYEPVMLLLFGFMLRGAAVEFRSKQSSYRWRYSWDFCFFFASLLLALMVGLLLGNLIKGIPLEPNGEYLGGLIPLFTYYPILVSLMGLSMFMMHGSIYMLMKTEGTFHNKMRRWAIRLIVIFLVLWLIVTISTLTLFPHMSALFFHYPILAIFPLISLSAIMGIIYFVYKKSDGFAFIASCLAIIFLLVLFIIGTFPNIARSSVLPETRSLTLFNSSASKTTLFVMTIIAFSGIPLSFFYGAYVYRVFRGKVKIGPMSY